MFKHRSRWVAVWLWGLMALLPQAAPAQYDVPFGKNKVNYSSYEWEYIQSEHFDIYFPHGAYRLAEFTAREAERALVRIQKDLKYTLHGRIPVVIYNSHNGFSETNIAFSEEIPEGVGGFTEFTQSRVVIPYEGSYDQLRHVIHHELVHAVTFEQLTGGEGIPSLVTQRRSLPPLWVAEGMAEYLSLGWDKGADNVMRDATITGYVPPIDQIWGGLFAYKGGQSIFLMIEEKYGKSKVAEFEAALPTSRTLDRAVEVTLGINLEKLSEEWHLWLKRRYWNDINLRKTPEEIAKKLTDRKMDQSFFNLAPAFSPQGDKIAFLTDRRTYVDIYLMSAIDGKVLGRLVEGEKSSKFETMFLLRPGITWSPDGREIAFIAKAGDRNALYTLNVKKKKVTRTLKFDLDGMFKPSWSPDGRQIAVVGLKDGTSDLYLIHLDHKSLYRITTDPYEETDPEWSPDGRWIAFSSDRPDASLKFTGSQDFPFGHYNVFTMRPDGTEIRRVTQGIALNQRPTWSPDGKKIAFISDRSGVGNVYIAELDSLVEQPAFCYPTQESAMKASRPETVKLPLTYPVTNLLASAQDLHWSPDGRRIAFSAFHRAGYDIYVLKDPLTHKMKDPDIPPTLFASHLVQERMADTPPVHTLKDTLFIILGPDSARRADRQRIDTLTVDSPKVRVREEQAEEWGVDQSVLTEVETSDKAEKDKGKSDKKMPAPKDTGRVGLPEKGFEVHKYRLKFKPELFAANTGFDTFYGVSGLAQLSMSDVLGNHRAFVATNLNFSLKDSQLLAGYAYLRRRTHYSGMLYHTRYFFLTSSQLAADRLYGMDLQLERPFNKFSRFEMSASLLNISRELINNYYRSPFARGGFFAGTTRGLTGQSLPTRRAYSTSLALVNDNTLTGYFGPVDGSRSRLSLERSWYGLRFSTVELDTRRYFLIGKNYTFALRLAGGASYGRNKQVFFLGGVNNEINPRYAANSRLNDLSSDNLFFSRFVWPLRGLNLFEQAGDTYLLSNVEFRFPIVRQLLLGWPLPLFFQDVEGDLFFDIGGAFDRARFDPWDVRDGGIVLNGFDPAKRGGLAAAYGLGVRVNVGIFLFRYDLAWPTDLSKTYGLKQYFSADIQGLF